MFSLMPVVAVVNMTGVDGVFFAAGTVASSFVTTTGVDNDFFAAGVFLMLAGSTLPYNYRA